ncbi:hypothetical protein HGH92_21860 [Chitinophaga varians]|uniref:Uncharacterized protein n=1 Tax=Chitinophaga varians TaxID=2202339 RepID=A0A847RIV7_9BACT|nr:hypothetical protein [Chitinophaga varians]NLR66969.1 hypothetical protein [Chitinophaga varians]
MDNWEVSEKHRKFLLEVRFAGKVYYTVQGADTSDKSYDDKWLTDTEGKILLFSSPDDLYTEIMRMDEIFDKTEMRAWAVARLDDYEPYAVVDLDLLENAQLQLVNRELISAIYITLGLLKDYVIQVDDVMMLLLLEDSVTVRFLDDWADYIVWGKKMSAKLEIDKTLFPLLKALYSQLSEKIKIHR